MYRSPHLSQLSMLMMMTCSWWWLPKIPITISIVYLYLLMQIKYSEAKQSKPSSAQRRTKINTHTGCRPTHRHLFPPCLSLYFPYLLFGIEAIKKTWWCVTRVAVIKGLCEEKEGELDEERVGVGGQRGSNVFFFLCAFSCMVIGPAAPALPQ